MRAHFANSIPRIKSRRATLASAAMAQKSNAPVGLPRVGKRRHTGSAVGLKGHVDPYGNEQGDCRKPDQARDEISPAPARFPHPIEPVWSAAGLGQWAWAWAW